MTSSKWNSHTLGESNMTSPENDSAQRDTAEKSSVSKSSLSLDWWAVIVALAFILLIWLGILQNVPW